MIPERWQLVKEVFDGASALEGAARADYLAGACQHDAELRSQVESLLVAHARPDAILDAPVHQYLDPSELEPPADAWIGKMVGPYRLMECIGRGGMGSVYRAQRADAQFEQEVAIKVMRAGAGGNLVLQRFRAERQI